MPLYGILYILKYFVKYAFFLLTNSGLLLILQININVLFLGVFLVAGNENSGKSLPFKMSEEELKRKINSFRDEFADGSKGMVTWPRFCAYLGYSIEEVRDVFIWGKESKNAYSGRADLLGKFQTECHALTSETCDKKQQLARDEIKMDYLRPPGQEDGPPEVRILFGNGDDRWIEAMK